MKPIFKTLMLGAIWAALSAAGFAQSGHYVLTNDVNTSNSATLFKLNTSDGSLAQVRVLQTGGEGVQGGYYAGVTQAISPAAACIFVADGDTSDIATFSKATHYAKVGNYSDSSFKAASNMPMLLNSAGTILYAAYEESSTLAVWKINSDCSLTLGTAYKVSFLLGSLAITHDGSMLLGTYSLRKKVESWAISGTTLTSNGIVSTPENVSGIAVTNDDTVVILGTGYNEHSFVSGVITASLPGFTNQQEWKLGPGNSAASIALSAAGAAGSGCLYVGNTGNGTAGSAGVTGAMFTENPLNVTYVNNVTSTLATSIGNVATISNTGNGDGVYAAETVGNIAVVAANSGCTVKLVKENADPNSTFLLSLTSWQP